MVAKMIGMLISEANVRAMARLGVSILEAKKEMFEQYFDYEELRNCSNEIVYFLACIDPTGAENFLVKKMDIPRWMAKQILKMYLVNNGKLTVELMATAILQAVEIRLDSKCVRSKGLFTITAI
jgi:hypothetical protein